MDVRKNVVDVRKNFADARKNFVDVRKNFVDVRKNVVAVNLRDEFKIEFASLVCARRKQRDKTCNEIVGHGTDHVPSLSLYLHAHI